MTAAASARAVRRRSIVDGKPVGKGRIERTHAFFFSMDETMEVGCDVGEPVSPDYGPRGNEFSGKIKWVQIDMTTRPRMRIISRRRGAVQSGHGTTVGRRHSRSGRQNGE
jgi:hypothetical protein